MDVMFSFHDSICAKHALRCCYTETMVASGSGSCRCALHSFSSHRVCNTLIVTYCLRKSMFGFLDVIKSSLSYLSIINLTFFPGIFSPKYLV